MFGAGRIDREGKIKCRIKKKFHNNGMIKLLIIVGTRPEIIRLSEVIQEMQDIF